MKPNAQVIDLFSKLEKSDTKPKFLFAKISGGEWYAIPRGLAESLRQAGAEIRVAEKMPKQ